MKRGARTHDARGVINPDGPQQSAVDRDSLLRIEIYGPAEPAMASAMSPTPPALPASEPAPAPQAAPAPPVVDEHVLTRREEAVVVEESEMIRREAALIRREQALTGSDGLVEAGTTDVERRERKMAHMESTIHERMVELDERESLVERREIELEGAFGLREDRIEFRETELADLEQRLRRKEEDLARYVSQVQAQFARRD